MDPHIQRTVQHRRYAFVGPAVVHRRGASAVEPCMHVGEDLFPPGRACKGTPDAIRLFAQYG